ncbi:MAG: sulfotransferase [Planctomycetales bacterium]|nr:sulfotransferase [Planctomycetales bacterium]
MACDDPYAAFHIPLSQHLLSYIIHGHRGLWRRLGNIESNSIRDQIDRVAIRKPVYVTGLARSGSTILLEILATHSEVATHRYRDFWTLYTPYWSAKSQRHVAPSEAVERSHGDGIMITPDSPEAMEEILWMSFFPKLHDPAVANVLTDDTSNLNFEQFYRDHIRKLLLVRKRSRYVAKGNYNLTRLSYLHKLFPDAHFVIPIRDPRDHIASLQKQHELLIQAARVHPRSVTYLDRVGHFEFGQHRIPLNTGSREAVDQIERLWNSDQSARGWARYWAQLYQHVAETLENDPSLRECVTIIRYEELCSDPAVVLSRLFSDCALDNAESIIANYAERLHRPTYYRPQFTDAEETAIEEETRDVASWFGYETSQNVA